MTMILFLFLAQAPAQDPSALDRLRRGVEEAKRELKAETERLAAEDTAEEAEIARVRQAVAKLTDELVERTESLSRKSKEVESLRSERSAEKKERDSASQTWIELHRTATDMRQKLADLLDALPPSERRSEQKLRIEQARSELEHPPGEPLDLRPLLSASRSILAEAGSVAAFTEPLRNSEGVREEAQVLRAGMIFHAYQGKSSGRVGEVAAAPAGQGGFRWTESLPDWARQDLKTALGKMSGSAPPPILELPIDVTQRLAPERRDSSRSIVETLRAGGPVMVPLLGVGLLALLVSLERFVTLTLKSGGRAQEVIHVLDLCRKSRFDQAIEQAQKGRSVRMRAVLAALGARGIDRAHTEEAVRQAVLREMPALERFLSLLAVLAGISPMLGLLGTVTGMIRTFDIIRLFGSGDPGIMAGGISEALVATATGLVIAIPILLVHSFVSGRVDRILADSQIQVATLLPLLGDPEAQEVARG